MAKDRDSRVAARHFSIIVAVDAAGASSTGHELSRSSSSNSGQGENGGDKLHIEGLVRKPGSDERSVVCGVVGEGC